MAATFIVEDGTGLVDANAYITVAFADQYHENFGAPTDWSSSTTANKEQAIREATRYLDAGYSSRWRGARASEEQALDHPRRRVFDVDGWTRDSDEVFVEVQQAAAIAALKSRQGELFLPDVDASEVGISSESVSVGPISESKSYAGTKRTFKRFSLIEATLRPIIERAGKRERA
jgi:hypothetical protein